MTVLEVTRGLLDPKPLLDAAGYVPGEQGARATAERLGVSQRQVVRWAQGERIRSVTADQCAIRLDRHPAEIWGGVWTDVSTDGEVIELPQRDQKAGWSTECRADRHRTCAMAGMRCSCDCHGRTGQTPPAPALKTPPVVQRPLLVVAPDPKETPMSDEFPCEEAGCDRSFGTAHARQVHVARGHKKDRPARATKAKPPAGKVEPPAPKVEAKQLLVVDREHFFEVDTVPDLERVADLLSALGHDVLLAVPR